MLTLSPQQRDDASRLLGAGLASSAYLPSTLLIGEAGVGKRTIARWVSDDLGLKFTEIPLDAPVTSVREMLFGSREQARLAELGGEAPGEAGRGYPVVLYLSGLEHVHPNLQSILHRLIAQRRYVDALGNEWSLSDDLWIIASICDPIVGGTLRQDHWLCRTFQARLRIELLWDMDNLRLISRSIADGMASSVRIEDDFIRALFESGAAHENLHLLRRCLEEAIRGQKGIVHIRASDLQRTRVSDTKWMVQRISYRGEILTMNRLEEWVRQFPNPLQAVALRLVEDVAVHYYVGELDFHRALDSLISGSEIPRGSEVVFCRWQDLGGSANRVAHLIKNQAGWKSLPEVDLLLSRPDGRGEGHRHRTWFVITDDFVGSGNSLARLFYHPGRAIPRLLQRFPEGRLRILIVVGFEEGMRRVREATRPYGDRVKIVVNRLFDDRDRCFHTASRIIPDGRQRDGLKAFCIQVARDCMPRLAQGMRLGYDDSGALVVFYDAVPNNTLPILWYPHGKWKPLFPRSGLSTT